MGYCLLRNCVCTPLPDFPLQVRLNCSTGSGLINEGGEGPILFSSRGSFLMCLLRISRLVILEPNGETPYERLCTPQSLAEVIPDLTFHDILFQDVDGNGRIDFDEVCHPPPPLSVFKSHTQHTVCAFMGIYQCTTPTKRTPALSDVVISNGGKCLMQLTLITTAELIPTNWARRWPTTSTLARIFVTLSPHPRSLLQSPCRHKRP